MIRGGCGVWRMVARCSYNPHEGPLIEINDLMCHMRHTLGVSKVER
jgi:hypothetical protein